MTRFPSLSALSCVSRATSIEGRRYEEEAPGSRCPATCAGRPAPATAAILFCCSRRASGTAATWNTPARPAFPHAWLRLHIFNCRAFARRISDKNRGVERRYFLNGIPRCLGSIPASVACGTRKSQAKSGAVPFADEKCADQRASRAQSRGQGTSRSGTEGSILISRGEASAGRRSGYAPLPPFPSNCLSRTLHKLAMR